MTSRKNAPSGSEQIQAVVVSCPREGIVKLQWRVLVQERQETIRMGDGSRDTITIPEYGEILASVARPHQEFLDAMDEGIGLAKYVEEHLPRPERP
jgi:hypothetical protein